jgi:MFS family permease
VLNFVAGRLSERIGRKHVLMLGWIAAVPIPFMIYFAPDWNWIVAATVLLGINQGLAWSMTQTAKLDITRADQRGLTIGFNEFSGYVGVALAGIITGYAAAAFGPRLGLLVFGLVVVVTPSCSRRSGCATRCLGRRRKPPVMRSLRQGRHEPAIPETSPRRPPPGKCSPSCRGVTGAWPRSAKRDSLRSSSTRWSG